MADARWGDVFDDLNSSVRHLDNAVKIYRQSDFSTDDLDSYQAEMAFMHAIQSGYTSFENSLKRILDILAEQLPTGESWHSDLLKRCVKEFPNLRPAILSRDTYRLAGQLPQHECRSLKGEI